MAPGTRPLVYHYTAPAAAFSIITSNAIWATDIRFLNDGSEYQAGVAALKRLLSGRLARVGKDVYLPLIDRWFEQHVAQAFVASFSSAGDSLSQWRAYCPAGGYALELDAEYLAAAVAPYAARLAECAYHAETHETALDPFIERLNVEMPPTHVGDPTAWDDLNGAMNFVVPDVLPQLKHYAFYDEREWRLIVHENGRPGLYGGPPPKQFRAVGDLKIPFIAIPFDGGQPPVLPIVGAVVAPCPEASRLRDELSSFLEAEGHLAASLRVRSSEIPYRSTPTRSSAV